MAKKKGKSNQVRIDRETLAVLEKASQSDPIQPTIGQLIRKLVKQHGHTLYPDNRPG